MPPLVSVCAFRLTSIEWLEILKHVLARFTVKWVPGVAGIGANFMYLGSLRVVLNKSFFCELKQM